MLVLDASVAVAWYLEDEATAETDRLAAEAYSTGILVPQMWHLEVANALLGAVRRGRISRRYRDDVFDDFGRYDIKVDDRTLAHAWSSTTALVDRYDLTPYDAAYLELALRVRLPLATTDKKLAAAARAEGVEVLP